MLRVGQAWSELLHLDVVIRWTVLGAGENGEQGHVM